MTQAEKKLRPLGWQVSHTDPLRQAFHFDRFIGRRRVASVTLRALSEPKAWRELRKLLTTKTTEATP